MGNRCFVTVKFDLSTVTGFLYVNDMRWTLGTHIVEVDYLAGAGVRDVADLVGRGRVFDTIVISVLGNDFVTKAGGVVASYP